MLSSLRKAQSALNGLSKQPLPGACRWLHASSDDGLSYMHNPGTGPLLETTIGHLAQRAAERWPNEVCVHDLADSGLRLTYSQLLRRADRLAAGLREIGLRPGDRIGIWGPNSHHWLLAYVASARAGLICAGINPFYQQSEIEYCVKKIEAKAVFAPRAYRSQNYADMLLKVKGGDRSSSLEHLIIYSDDDHVAGTRKCSDLELLASSIQVEAIGREQDEISPRSGTNIQFTSGTTGNPKATLISHRSMVNNSRQAVERLGISRGARICLNVPYFHAFGMIMGVSGPLHAGSTVVLESPTFNPARSIDAIVRHKCDVTFGTPTMWINMIDVQRRTGARVDTLWTGSIGGAPASPSLYQNVREYLRMDQIKSIYGLTECTAICNQSLGDEAHELTDTTIGYISDHTEIKVIDENGDTVPMGKPGELCVRGYSTMMGYWGDEENTRRTLQADGWLRTGDQYVLRPDGYGHIVGRIKDMLIRGGENIFPKEIEAFLESHPAVLEAQVFGVHDDTYGEEVCACIRLKDDAKRFTRDDIVEYAKGRLAAFKVPKYVNLRSEFPKTTSGKIQKFKLKRELEELGVVPKAPPS
ncbi:acyl-CoA synthetase family member 2, mitochondrial [Trichogramma pretiosum]|uniref:acyl-CoA synthetase family member 2, mitochondrial n=1 Tax=Trichogramma pretiosum TaxID=7493 RepID=UPI0006C9667A|nr:acyl-CoA synthetase family member 2, mitochondrial [Trichogramma pretiosum]